MPISCRVTRGELTESIHVGFAVAVDENGHIFFSTGDPHYLTCIRSALKPFQAAASVKIGAVDAVGLIACSTRNGTVFASPSWTALAAVGCRCI